MFYRPLIGLTSSVRRILKRGGGYFERVRSVQTTLTRIFIDLESVSDGLSETWGEMSRKARKFKAFFRPKLGDLQKKKVFAKIQSDFSAKIRNSKVFSAQNQVISKKKKKRVFAKIQSDFSAEIRKGGPWHNGPPPKYPLGLTKANLTSNLSKSFNQVYFRLLVNLTLLTLVWLHCIRGIFCKISRPPLGEPDEHAKLHKKKCKFAQSIISCYCRIHGWIWITEGCIAD